MPAPRDLHPLPPGAGNRKSLSERRNNEPVRAPCALGILHAHYWRVLRRAETAGDVTSRAQAFAEARRLAGVTAALTPRATRNSNHRGAEWRPDGEPAR
jgi:hypothetical protein